MSKLKHLASLLLILCVTTIFIGCGVSKRGAEQSSSEMEEVREVGFDAKADLLVFAPDGKTLAACYSSPIQLWDASTGEKICEADKDATEGGCQSLAFSPDGTMLASVHAGPRELGRSQKLLVYLWQITPEKQLGKVRIVFTGEYKNAGCGSQVYGTHLRPSFSADGSALAVANPDGTVHVWETDTGSERVQFPGGVAVCFADDGKTLVTVTQGGVVHRWQTETGRVVRLDQDVEPDGYIYVDGLAFDAGGTRVAMSDRYAICIKDTQSGRTVSRMESPEAMSLCFAPNRTLVVASEGSLQIVDSVTGESRGGLRPRTGYGRALALSPDGKRVAWSDGKSVLVQRWSALAARAEIGMEPVVVTELGSTLKAELVANTDTYDLDLGGKTAEQFTSLAWPDRSPPEVDLSFRIRNTGGLPVSVRVWDKEELYGVYLLGEGAFNYSWCPQTGVPDVHIKTVSLVPGESFSFPVTQLLTFANKPYWLLPGEYTIHASARLKVSPPPLGVEADEDGFGWVDFEAAPVKVKVRAGR